MGEGAAAGRRGQALARAALVMAGALACLLALVASAQGGWSSYLHGPAHGSYDAQSTAITPANASSLELAWHFVGDSPTLSGQPEPYFFSSPSLWGNTVYLGSDNGYFYALSLTSGQVVWKRFIGFRPALTCEHARGFAATATLARDPLTGRASVYVAAPDGFLYALDAATGADVWPPALIALPSETESDYFDWSSPTVANGRIYVGVSSQCDHPLVRGALKSFDQESGAPLASYYPVPEGTLGGGIWTSAAVAGSGDVFVTTGNEGDSSIPGDSLSIVKLDGETLAKKARWRLSSSEFGKDRDFSASPTFFKATLGTNATETPLVGACAKTGLFYALRRNKLEAGPLWTFRVQNPGGICLPAAVWNGHELFLASTRPATIGGMSYPGAAYELDPATGATIWAKGLTGPIAGTPALNGSGVLALATYDTTAGDPNNAYLLDASSGSILATLAIGNGAAFPQPVFAGRTLLLAGFSGLYAYRLPGP